MQRNEIVEILLVAADFVLLTTDSDGVIKTATPAVRKIFNKQEGEVEGLQVNELIPPLAWMEIPAFEPIEPRGGMDLMGDDETTVSDCEYLEYLSAHQEQSGKFETKASLEEGNQWLEVATHKLDFDGEIVFSLTINDISKRKQAENEIREFNENLEQMVAKRTEELEGRSEQIKNVVNSCATELQQVNDNYQKMKERQMDLSESMEMSIIAGVEGLSDAQSSQIKEIFQEQMVMSMNLYSEDQITDQQFMLTIISLNEILGNTDPTSENLKPGQLSGTNQDEVDDLLDSLGI